MDSDYGSGHLSTVPRQGTPTNKNSSITTRSHSPSVYSNAPVCCLIHPPSSTNEIISNANSLTTSSLQHSLIPPHADPGISSNIIYSPILAVSSPSSSIHPSVFVLSPPASCPSVTHGLRFDVVLEAPPAASQRAEEAPVTYLNKGQFYSMRLADTELGHNTVTSTLAIMFHDEPHRRLAASYWKFWQSQQKDPNSARAIDIDTDRSRGVWNVECLQFDRITFEWSGQRGATIYVRFNCLSTDFSRIKGVKGIPLRLHIESKVYCHTQRQQTIHEATFCRVKLFRDKGAERKNKDDARHIEKQLEKLRGRSGETHSFWLAYYRTLPYTVFSEIPESIAPLPVHLMDTETGSGSSSDVGSVHGIKRSLSDTTTYSSPSVSTPGSDYYHQQADTGYEYAPPVQRRRTALLRLFVRFPSCELYRALYLEELTLQEFVNKLLEKAEVTRPVKEVVRHVRKKGSNKNSIVVHVDDTMIKEMTDGQDMDVEIKRNDDDTATVILVYEDAKH